MRKLAGVVAATAIAMGAGAVTATPASAVDNIKIFGEQERLIGPNGFPYIGYVVKDFGPSNDPVPHNGTLYSAKLYIDYFGGNYNPMIDRFGARALKGAFYPAIRGASNVNMLYFDVVGPVPNSVVWNDGIRDILAWVPGEIPLEGFWEAPPPPEPAPMPERSSIVPESSGSMPAEASAPAEADAAIVATPNDLAQPAPELTEAEVSEPGFGR
jgi:hypothetical protein